MLSLSRLYDKLKAYKIHSSLWSSTEISDSVSYQNWLLSFSWVSAFHSIVLSYFFYSFE